MALALALQP